MTQVLDNALAVPGAFLLIVCLTAKYVTPTVRRSIGKRVYAIAFRQCKGVARLQRCLRHPLLDVLTKLTALTVSVEWYLLSLPPLMWVFGQRGLIAGMAICQCMAVSTYMTCVLKDMLSCPRPYMFSRGADANASAGAATAVGTAAAAAAADGASAHGNAPPLDRAVAAAAAVTYDDGAAAAEPDSRVTDAESDLTTDPDRTPTQIRKQQEQPLPTTNAAAATSDPNGRKPKAGAGLTGAEAAAAAAVEGEAAREVSLLEEAYRNEVEYGAPSMHTWCALIMPAYAATAAAQLGAVGAGRAAALTAGAVCWAMWVGLTRLYLGVHTPVDLVLGALGGGAVLGLWRRLGLAQIIAAGATLPTEAAAAAAAAGGAAVWWPEEEDGGGGGGAWASWFGFRVERRLAALAAVGVLYVTALASYPVPESHTTSYEYAVIFLGAAYGGLLGCHPSCSLLSPLLQRETLVQMHAGGGNGGGAVGDGSWDQLGGGGGAAAATTMAQLLSAAAPPALRHPVAVLMLGFAFVAAVKLVSKALLSELLPKLLDLVPLRLRLLWQPPVHPSGCCVGVGGPQQQQQRSEKRKPSPSAAAAVAKTSSAAASAAALPCGGVLMKTPTLPYDVDFLRKFLNYGLTVFAAADFRFVAAVLLLPGGPLSGGVQG
ncbi:hypothetical protein PLESTB_001117300 [Pleodorina starrii]|uniref:Phosphatidic acid phosphatase type 2/haloperoxidase domain-containing protein n=1 Tax=Pleodorina starrii TaxID=330485 RepID=A0A9W6BRC7_9CHLO|nr:hypothetical protein PLESTM_001354400 [Pleodorina starrii]GLC56530.1 hypothetical protein PLESTB_001117300 [Pleodorina starrii]GLC68773.1 hypothetical protein PLESTF_000735200 [Pleodorina starrii]